MRKPFKKDWPLTQGWGENPQIYARFNLKGHNGQDYGLPNKTEVLAPHDGKVLEATNDPDGYGNYLKIESSVEGSVLAHLYSFKVSLGDEVKEGQVVALSDNTGFSTGDHLHWGYYRMPRNRNDGYLGYIDQTPYIGDVTQQTIDQLRLERDKNWNLYLAQIEEVKKRDERITQLEQEGGELKKKFDDEQKHTLELEARIADLAEEIKRDAEENHDYGTQLLDAEHERDEAIGALNLVREDLGLPFDATLDVIKTELQKYREPNEQTTQEYQKLAKVLFDDFVYKRVPKWRKSLSEWFWKRLR